MWHGRGGATGKTLVVAALAAAVQAWSQVPLPWLPAASTCLKALGLAVVLKPKVQHRRSTASSPRPGNLCSRAGSIYGFSTMDCPAYFAHGAGLGAGQFGSQQNDCGSKYVPDGTMHLLRESASGAAEVLFNISGRLASWAGKGDLGMGIGMGISRHCSMAAMSEMSGISRLCSLAAARSTSGGLSYFPELSSASGSSPLAGMRFPNRLPIYSMATAVASHSEAPENHGQLLVLYADKNSIDQEVVTMLLSSRGGQHSHGPGFKVVGVNSGKAAVDWVFNCKYLPDIVMLDLMLPDMNITEVVRMLRAHFTPVELPILLVTARSGEADALAALEKGVNDFLCKPLRLMELQARINSQLFVKQSVQKEAEGRSHYELLAQVLPPHIICRLAQGQAYAPEHHEQVTILFSDIVSFTELCSRWPTHEVVALLDRLFSSFDDICDKHGVFKVETIGDAYMIAAGHDGCTTDHAIKMAHCAIDMLAATEAINKQLGNSVQIRIGMHSGPALSGVVGKRRPRYCFFGDTVNTASRMESSGYPMCIHISDACKQSMLAAAAAGKGTYSAFSPLATVASMLPAASILPALSRKLSVSFKGLSQLSSAPSAFNMYLLSEFFGPTSPQKHDGAGRTIGRLRSTRSSNSGPNRMPSLSEKDLSMVSAAAAEGRRSSLHAAHAAAAAGINLNNPVAPGLHPAAAFTGKAGKKGTTLVSGFATAADSFAGFSPTPTAPPGALDSLSGSDVTSCSAVSVESVSSSSAESLSASDVDTASRVNSGSRVGSVVPIAAEEVTSSSFSSWAKKSSNVVLPCEILDLGSQHVKGKGIMKTHLLKVGMWKAALVAANCKQAASDAANKHNSDA